MFTKVIAGIDGRSGGLDALTLASRLAGADARLVLTHVTVIGAADYPFTIAEEAAVTDRGRAALGEAMAVATGRKPGRAGRPAVNRRTEWSTSVGGGLHRAAEAEGADLIVVGACHRHGLGRVIHGDDTRSVLEGAPSAVAIAPSGYAQAPDAIREIGAGFDDSPESRDALDCARTLGTEFEAQVSAYTAVRLPLGAFGPGALPVTGFVDGLLRDARRRITAYADVEARATFGPAIDGLAAYSTTVDLLVVGSHGHGPVGRLGFGSVARSLTRSARCALLILPRGRRRATEPTPTDRTEGLPA